MYVKLDAYKIGYIRQINKDLFSTSASASTASQVSFLHMVLVIDSISMWMNSMLGLQNFLTFSSKPTSTLFHRRRAIIIASLWGLPSAEDISGLPTVWWRGPFTIIYGTTLLVNSGCFALPSLGALIRQTLLLLIIAISKLNSLLNLNSKIFLWLFM